MASGRGRRPRLFWGHLRLRGAWQRQELCPPERMSEFVGWDTSYVDDTVTVLSSDSATTALGSSFGSREHINARAWESVRACDEMRSAIVNADHANTEMVLTRQCADVSKLMCRMRINGDVLDHDLLASFDEQLRGLVSASLCGDSWWQPPRGSLVAAWASARPLELPFTPSSPAASCDAPLVSSMVDHFSAAVGNSSQLIKAEHDTRADEALSSPLSRQLLPRSWLPSSCGANFFPGTEDAMQDQRHCRWEFIPRLRFCWRP